MENIALTKGSLGPGGKITDQALLDQLAEADKSLSAVELFRLAAFFRAYSTNKPLGDHLLLSALAMIVSDTELRYDLQKRYNLDNDSWDGWEDTLDCENELKTDKDVDPEPTFNCQIFYWFPFPDSDVGLVIESKKARGKGDKPSFFVVGVSPSPNSLPFTYRARRTKE